jgi:hypothetical protein
MKNKETNAKTETIMHHVSEIVDKLATRTTKLDFEQPFEDASIEDLRLHLGYVKAYSDLAKVKLSYYKTIVEEDATYEKTENV